MHMLKTFFVQNIVLICNVIFPKIYTTSKTFVVCEAHDKEVELPLFTYQQQKPSLKHRNILQDPSTVFPGDHYIRCIKFDY